MKPTTKQLTEFAQKHSWQNQMQQSNGLDSFNNYSGEGIGHAVVVVGRNRDSEVLSESNFEAALHELGGESETVQIHRFGHWGCGWFELLTVDPNDKKALRIAYDIKQRLVDYPVLDEDNFYERENEYQTDYAESSKDELAKAIVTHLGLPEELATDTDMLQLAFELNVECQRYYGNDSCINVYPFREPDDSDWERVVICLEQIYYSGTMENNAAFEYLYNAFNVGGTK